MVGFADLDEQPQDANLDAAAGEGTSNGGHSKGTAATRSGGDVRSSRLFSGRTGARGDSAEGTIATAPFTLKETDGRATQAPPLQVHMGRNTQVVVS